MDDCWTRIGVRGDRSCPELLKHVHCRNCPTYSAGAMRVLEGPASDQHVLHWTKHLALPKKGPTPDVASIFVFRVGGEWLALPASCVSEVVNLIPIHSLPHRTGGVVVGVASVRGELTVCISLQALLSLDGAAPAVELGARTIYERLLVIRREQVRAVCPVDEVHGIHRFHPRELQDLPATVARATATYSKALLPWRGRSVGLLDPELLFYSLKRSVA